jgi:hypothetical protein
MNNLDPCGGFLVPPELVAGLEKLLKPARRNIMQLQIGDRTYVNSETIVRWSYDTIPICGELTMKDVFHIEVTVWLTDGTTAQIWQLEGLRQFGMWVTDCGDGRKLYGKVGTFAYYLERLVTYEDIGKEKSFIT